MRKHWYCVPHTLIGRYASEYYGCKNNYEKDDLVELVVKYFEKVDAGDPSYLDLFSEDVDFFFPK
ncbi:hypothetical protein OWC56_14780, partial [Vibrio diabolicus]|nr:hypothetical protein [Vibrio diabolicus]